MKVNMTPNPLDVVTIHASQGDTEARQWEFELHNNGEKIDSSSISDQMVFKAYEGGTEQILPENGSTPTTSPFKGDIRYPQGLLSDQEFTYRQSPTEEDGLAKITDIKGNTIVWNQLVQNGNFADTSKWASVGSATINSVSNNTINVTTTATAQSGISNPNLTMVQGHKYLLVGTVKTTGQTYISISGVGSILFNENTFKTKSNIITWASATGSWAYMIRNWDTNSATFEARNIMLIDLTQMGLDSITNPAEFTSLFPLPYYDYNQGSLLSFNGNGIKTVGKNFFNGYLENTRTSAGFYIRDVNTSDQPAPIKFPKGTYTFSIKSNVQGRAQLGFFSGGKTNDYMVINPLFTINVGTTTLAFTVEKDIDYIRMYGNFAGTLSDAQIEFGSATEYEPYISSTLSLPISTYFPNGMDGVGTDYDELTNTKATTRMTRVDLGSLTWTKESRQNRFNSRALEDAKSFPSDSVANAICAKYITITADDTYFGNDGLSIDSGGRVNIYDSAYASATASDFKTAMSGVYLVYPLATPTETPITTASLVTENAEIPLSNDDGVLIGKCTEELSAEPGFHDAKIKLADSDGECYSNKIQLHIERSPQ